LELRRLQHLAIRRLASDLRATNLTLQMQVANLLRLLGHRPIPTPLSVALFVARWVPLMRSVVRLTVPSKVRCLNQASTAPFTLLPTLSMTARTIHAVREERLPLEECLFSEWEMLPHNSPQLHPRPTSSAMLDVVLQQSRKKHRQKTIANKPPKSPAQQLLRLQMLQQLQLLQLHL
jgi:hypothetical protein